MQDDARTRPLRIDAQRAAGTLRVEWADGHLTTYDTVTLRWLCPCAYCRGEAGLPGWLDSNPVLSQDQTKLVNMALVGNYAVQPVWGDGHDSGFHSFMLLREQCPCDACTADRARRGADDGRQPAGDAGDRHWHGGNR
jgi:DUF971 family protein